MNSDGRLNIDTAHSAWARLGACLPAMGDAFRCQNECGGGESFEKWVCTQLANRFPEMVKMSASEFRDSIRMSPTQRIYKDRNMDFRGEVGPGVFLVPQPCNGQGYCDTLLILNSLGIMIETKGAEDGHAKWNCHVPVDGPHLYLFAKTRKGAADMTWSMGRNLLDAASRKNAEIHLEVMREINRANGSLRGALVAGDGYQPERSAVLKCRQSWEDPILYTSSVNRPRRENDALQWLEQASRMDRDALASDLSDWRGSMGMA